MATQFPAIKARRLLAALLSVGYVEKRRKGSHRRLECVGRSALTFSFHDNVEVSGRLVKKVLTVDAGMTEDEAKEILGI